ncbi:hypothetical protein BUALT_Bualt03G0039500 [Buddleja alternifolia]|uniref:Uncharacterized protein n=1 Tax=Buddleja alternifolia TaxID=168488 RepID=A0AAV6XS84_9LAMI|nr:hypothetical protein BUALT_Bualt03G0039500 [Buddleja alternifolia]
MSVMATREANRGSAYNNGAAVAGPSGPNPARRNPGQPASPHGKSGPDTCTGPVKSVIPFSEPYTVDPENPPPEKDYNVYFQTLKDGITGKESLEQTPVPV